MKTSKETANELQTLISHKYVVDEQALARFANVALEATDAVVGIRQAYLRVLLAGTQLALGESSPTVHGTRSHTTLDESARKTQLQALTATHERYYAIVVAAVTTPDIADSPRAGDTERHRRALERNRRTNYARTAKSALKALVDAGYSLLEISVMTASKGSILQLVRQRRVPASPTADRSTNRLKSLTDRIVVAARAFAEVEPAKASEATRRAMTSLGAIALEFGAKPARSLDVGFREHRPVRMKEGMFWPIDTGGIEIRTTQ